MVLAPRQALIFQIIFKRILQPRFETTSQKVEKAFRAGMFQFGGLLGGEGLPQKTFRKVCAAESGSAVVPVSTACPFASASGRSLHHLASAPLKAV